MPTKTERKKAINQQLRQLRDTWRRWRNAETGDPGCVDFDILCPIHRNTYRNGRPLLCGDPACEGCRATAYRADRMTEIKTEADALKAELTKLRGKPAGAVQELLFG